VLDLGMGLVWFVPGLDMVWACCGLGVGLVWAWFGIGSGLVCVWFGHGLCLVLSVFRLLWVWS
jgi:hypothetical protein